MDMFVGGYGDGRKFKLSIEYNIGLFIARCAFDVAKHRDRLIVVVKGAPIGHAHLHGAANH